MITLDLESLVHAMMGEMKFIMVQMIMQVVLVYY